MHYEIVGQQDAGARAILLSSGLGGLGSFWQPQLEALARQFKVILYDHRGTGKSPAQLPADYSIADMAEDVQQIVDELGVTQIDFIGHALGGLVGVQLALQRPRLIRRMIIVNGWARADSHTGRCFAVRKDLLRDSGVAAYVRAQPIFLYPAPWLSANAQRIAEEEQHAIAHFPGVPNVLARIEALLEFDPGEQLPGMRVPTLVLAARDDVLVPYTCSEQLAALLPAATLQLLASGGHGCTVTVSDECNRAMIDFLQS
ncbi:MAG: pyrimidine utilization protein [Herbaspirillum sp.]|jgi:aminoacrylate hydrolase|nr:pyrimidine utilization protein [Herbaspirillum sp.]